jgi:tetraacyldisaccharide 4'-kinase
LLDDAFQHRRVKGGFNILLTTWDQPFFRDQLLPAGNLRDIKGRCKAADLVVVTKSPSPLPAEAEEIKREIEQECRRNVLFNSLDYQEFIEVKSGKRIEVSKESSVILLTAIAKPEPLRQRVKGDFHLLKHIAYPDHNAYTTRDIQELRNIIDNFAKYHPKIITTEKDAVKLEPLWEAHDANTPLIYWKIGVDFGSYTQSFKTHIREYLSAH